MKVSLKYGGLVGLASFSWILVEYWAGWRTTDFGTHLTTSLLAVVILVIGIVLAVSYRRSQLGKRFSFASGFLTGLSVSLVAGLVMVAGQYLYLTVIDSNYLDRAKAWNTYVQVLDGTPFETAKANTAEGDWKYTVNARALGQIPYFLAQGVVISSVVSLITLKKRH